MLPSIPRGRPRRNHGPPPVPPIPNNGSDIVWTPGQDTTAYESAVVELLNNERPESTRRALDPKIDQYYSYCDQAYPDDRYKYILNEKYVFRFMFYQVMRSQRKRGGRHSTRPPPLAISTTQITNRSWTSIRIGQRVPTSLHPCQ